METCHTGKLVPTQFEVGHGSVVTYLKNFRVQQIDGSSRCLRGRRNAVGASAGAVNVAGDPCAVGIAGNRISQ